MPPDRNSKQSWIFLRGLSRESGHWEDFPAAFQRKFPGVSVHPIDLPGNGEFFDAATPTSLNGLLEFVRDQWKSREPGGNPPYIFALSLGAMVTLQWMHRYPKEVAGAVLVNTSLRGFSPFFQRMSPGAYGTLLRLFLDRDPKSRERRILDLTSQQRDWDEGMLRKRAEIQKKRPVGKLNALRQLIAALSTVDTKTKPPQPVLILNSLGDLLVHPDCSKAIADAWKVPLRRHAWAGHDLTLDDPQWTLRVIEEWLTTLQTEIKPDKQKAPR